MLEESTLSQNERAAHLRALDGKIDRWNPEAPRKGNGATRSASEARDSRADDSELTAHLLELQTLVRGSEEALNRRLVKIEARLETLDESRVREAEAAGLAADDARARSEEFQTSIQDTLRTHREETEKRLGEEGDKLRESLQAQRDEAQKRERETAQALRSALDTRLSEAAAESQAKLNKRFAEALKKQIGGLHAAAAQRAEEAERHLAEEAGKLRERLGEEHKEAEEHQREEIETLGAALEKRLSEATAQWQASLTEGLLESLQTQIAKLHAAAVDAEEHQRDEVETLRSALEKRLSEATAEAQASLQKSLSEGLEEQIVALQAAAAQQAEEAERRLADEAGRLREGLRAEREKRLVKAENQLSERGRRRRLRPGRRTPEDRD